MSKRFRARRLAAAPLGLLFLLIAIAPLPAQGFAWEAGFSAPGFNGPVTQAITWEGEIVAGGAFGANGEETMQHVAGWNGATWIGKGTPNFFECTALAVYAGELWASGYQSTNPADIQKWNGSTWVSAVPGLQGTAFAALNYGGRLILAGSIFHNFILYTSVAWDGAAIAPTYGPDGRQVGDMVELGGLLYSGGSFSEIYDENWNPLPMHALAVWDGSVWAPVLGRSSPGGPLVEGLGSSSSYPAAQALAVLDGKLVVAGSFDLAGDLSVSNIARWDPATQLWDDMGGGSPQAIGNLAVSGGQLYAAGSFNSIGGVTVANFARWTGSAWENPGAGTNGTIHTIEDTPAGLFVGGAFTEAGGQMAERAALWTGSAFVAVDNPGGAGLDDRVNALAEHGGLLVAAGRFTHAGLEPRGRIAGWDGAAWSEDFAGGADGEVRALLSTPLGLVAAGSFASLGGTTAANIAVWDGLAWEALGPGAPASVYGLTWHDDALHMAGFQGGTAFIERWDGAAWQAIPLTSTLVQPQSLGSLGGELIAGGSFWRFPAYGDLLAYTARWNGVEWLPLLDGCGGSIDRNVRAVWQQENALLIGSSDSFFDCDYTENFTGVWDGALLHRLEPVGMSGGNGVNLSACQAGLSFAGRQILGGIGSYGGGRLWQTTADGQAWEILAGDVSGTVYALCASGDALAVAGSFTRVGTPYSSGGGVASTNFALLQPTQTAVVEGAPAAAGLGLEAWPNPFNPKTSIHYTLVAAGPHRLRVLDLQGRQVALLRDGRGEAGANAVEWDAQAQSSGIYFVQLEVGGERLSRKLVLMK